MSDSYQRNKDSLSTNLLDSKLVARATRLVVAYMISLVLLISAIVAGYVVLRHEMATQRALSEANTHINVIHRTINASVGLFVDLNDAANAKRTNPRLIQVIRQRINKTLTELDTRSSLLEVTKNRLEGSTHWNDFKWIYETLEDNQSGILNRYVGQMRQLVNRREALGIEGNRPQIPHEAAGARHGALSTKFRNASEQLAEIITRHSNRVEVVHQQLTFLILGMFFMMSFLIVIPLWRRLIQEHSRHELAHKELYNYAYTDQETGLPNLDGFEQHILPGTIPSHEISNCYLLLIRLRNLDEIYNLIGSRQSLQLHQLFCNRLKSSHIGGQNWSRSSESEYTTVITQDLLDRTDDWLEPLFNELSNPAKVAGILVRPLISMAVSQLDEPQTKGGGQLREHQANARMALPSFDRTTLRLPVYEIALTHELTKQNELITAITDGIKNYEFVPFYQVKVDAKTGEPCSMEVLCRWMTADGGMVSPDKFIPAAEKSGQIVPMTYQLLEQVINDVQWWSEKRLRTGVVAINVSADVLQNKDFITRICDARKTLQSVQSDLEIEITENIAIESSTGITRKILQRLTENGVSIAIDDFGTGYASLQTLIDLPFDVLKIDRSFVTPMTEKGSGNEVVSAMISLSSRLRKRSVIEGVEFEWQWHQLASLGADELQGYFFHKPSCATDVCDWLMCNQNWREAG